MPTYDYECGKCGHRFEKFQSIMAKPARKCPGCGRQTAKRLIGTGAGIIFKGSGFYETDYKRNGSKGTGTPAAGSEGKSEAKTETKTETKSESKSETKSSKAETASSKPAKE